ncbi:MAG: cytochrome c biogenesis protein ResB [Actinobacteria bacterium]|nr:MAG: cytochrome c biogenesis protein ResB [Actinomycetota bacterium]
MAVLNPPTSALRVESDLPQEAAEAAALAVAGRWSIRRPVTGSGMLLERGRFGWWGSMVLHCGLVLLLLAGVVSALTRFSGTMVIAEGQTIADARESYVDITEMPRMGTAFGEFAIGMDSIRVSYRDGVVVDAAAQMRFKDGSVEGTRAVRVNQPLKVQGKSFLLGTSGHSVGIRVIQPAGDPQVLNVNLGEAVKQGYADTVKMSDGTLSLLSVPDFQRRADAAVDMLDLRDPAVLVAAGSQSVWLKPGESAPVGPYMVSLQDVSLWTTLLVRADRGLPIAYVAFVLVILGMLARWLDPDGVVALKADEDGTGYRVWFRDRHGSRAAERAAAAVASAIEQGRGGD